MSNYIHDQLRSGQLEGRGGNGSSTPLLPLYQKNLWFPGDVQTEKSVEPPPGTKMCTPPGQIPVYAPDNHDHG